MAACPSASNGRASNAESQPDCYRVAAGWCCRRRASKNCRTARLNRSVSGLPIGGGHRPEPEPLLLRRAHVLFGRAPARLLVFLLRAAAADRVGGQRLAPLASELLGRRELRAGAAAAAARQAAATPPSRAASPCAAAPARDRTPCRQTPTGTHGPAPRCASLSSCVCSSCSARGSSGSRCQRARIDCTVASSPSGAARGSAPRPAAEPRASPSSVSYSRQLAGDGDLVAVLVALEEAIARGAEALPDRLGLVLLHRTDRLPLGLQLLDARPRRSPTRSSRRATPPRAERFLPGEVRGPRLLAMLQIVLAAREEAIAGGAEPFPDGLLMSARHRADGLPLGLQRLDLLRPS